jgi:predicted O-linked N-acetylglucosamine transferase (SPINDLY family)
MFIGIIKRRCIRFVYLSLLAIAYVNKFFLKVKLHLLSANKPTDASASSAVGADLLTGAGQRALERGDIADALEYLVGAVRFDQKHGVALGLLGVAATRAGNSQIVVETARRVSCLPHDELRNVLRVGTWFSDTHRLGEQFSVRESENWRAFCQFAHNLLDVMTADSAAMFSFAKIAYHLRLLSLSKLVLSRYLVDHPDDPEALGMLIDAQLSLCDLSNYNSFVKGIRDRVHRDLEKGDDCKIDPYNLLSIGVDYSTYAQICALRSERIIADQGVSSSAANLHKDADHSGRLRVAFLLPYSWFASLNMVLKPLISQFDRTRFEISAYTMQSAPQPDEFEAAYRRSFDRCVDIPMHDPAAAAARIRADGIDILLETSGHTRTNCLSIAAHRPAPVQAHYLGYSNAISAPFIDYLIADEMLIPLELQSVCPDKFALMPYTVATYPKAQISTEPRTRRDYNIPDEVFCYCSFNHLSKIEPKIVSAWLQILYRVSNSILVLCHWNLAESVENLRDAARREGIDPKRLRFVEPLPHESHLQRLQFMNLALDTYYMGGGVTTLDALWVGLPVLTVRPDRLMPHNGADMLCAVQVPELIVSDLDGYVAEAVRLATDPIRLDDFRRRLERARGTSVLFNHEQYVKQFEGLVETMWEIYRSGSTPASFCGTDRKSAG